MSHGVYLLSPDVNNLSQLSVVVMPASANRVGGIMQGIGTSIASTGVMTLAPATANAIGGVIIGSGINVGSDGTISVTPASNYVLPPATSSVLGGVKIGANISVAGDGTISVAAPTAGYTLPPATANVLGGVKVGANITVQADGTISVAAPTAPYVLPVATANVLGGVKIGSNIVVQVDGTISLPTTVAYTNVSNNFTTDQTITGGLHVTTTCQVDSGIFSLSYLQLQAVPAVYRLNPNTSTLNFDVSSNSGSSYTTGVVQLSNAGVLTVNTTPFTVTSANTTATKLIIANTSSSGQQWSLSARGSSGTAPWFLLYNETTAQSALAINAATTGGRVPVKFPSTGVLGFANSTDALAGTVDIAFQRKAANQLWVTNGAATPADADLFCGAVTASGLVTVSAAGITFNPNSGTPGNTFKVIVNSSGNLEFDASTNNGSVWTSGLHMGGAGNVFVDQNLSVTGTSTLTGAVTANSTLGVVGNTTLHNNLTLYSPDNSRTLALNQPNGGDPSVTSSTAILNIATTNLRVLSGYQIQAWGPTNAQYGNFVVDSNNALNIGMTGGGNIIFNGPQVWGGGVNANTQNLSNVNTLTAQAATLNGGSFLLYGLSSKYYQVLPNDATYADPRIYSSTGNIRVFCGMSWDGIANFTNAANITFGSNFVAWNPTINTNAGTLTVTGWYNCFWCRVGPMGYLTMRVQFNITGTAPNWIYVYLPVAAVNPNNYAYLGAATIETGGGVTAAWAHARIENTDHILIQQQNNAAFPIGNGYMLSFSGWYRIV